MSLRCVSAFSATLYSLSINIPKLLLDFIAGCGLVSRILLLLSLLVLLQSFQILNDRFLVNDLLFEIANIVILLFKLTHLLRNKLILLHNLRVKLGLVLHQLIHLQLESLHFFLKLLSIHALCFRDNIILGRRFLHGFGHLSERFRPAQRLLRCGVFLFWRCRRKLRRYHG